MRFILAELHHSLDRVVGRVWGDDTYLFFVLVNVFAGSAGGFDSL